MPALAGPGTRLLRAAAAAVLALLLPLVVLTGCGRSGATTASGSGSSVTASRSDAPVDLAPARGVSGLPTVTVDVLPAEAVATLRLIAAGGPFPYAKDGASFGNRERLLPSRPSGFYTEYTVVTPGSADRGARRIVAGGDGSRFYTDDHYDSFREVVQP